MRDEQLKSFGLSAAGDIILLKEFCTERSEKIPTMELEPRKKRATLLKRMMEEMGSSGTTRLRSASQCNTTGRPRAVSKSVTLGLRIPKGIASEAYRQIKSPLGDSTTVFVDIRYDEPYESCIKRAIEVFFPTVKT